MKNNKITLGFIVALLCLLLIGCSQTTATANPIVKPTPTQTPAPTLRCNIANVACFYQDEATGGPCYDKDGNVLSGWVYASGSGCVFDGANPGSNATPTASLPTVKIQNIAGGWMFVDANVVRYLDITQDAVDPNSVSPNSATIHATLTVIGASAGNGCCDKTSRLLEGNIATGAVCSNTLFDTCIQLYDSDDGLINATGGYQNGTLILNHHTYTRSTPQGFNEAVWKFCAQSVLPKIGVCQ